MTNPSEDEGPAVRRNQAWMWPEEKQRYVQAVSLCKRMGLYDWYIDQHAVISYYAHGGPSFLPWHRQFIRQFEQQLHAVDPGVALPYWDWTVDRNTTESSLWSDLFMGGNGKENEDNQVFEGPFTQAKGWICHDPTQPDLKSFLRRKFAGSATLPTPQDLKDCLAEPTYDTYPWNTGSQRSFRNHLEASIHNRVHGWVGGNMLLMSSPNDPVFFLHHANIDRVWALWQQTHPDAYVPVTDADPGQNRGDLMKPWDQQGWPVTINDVLDHQALGYRYDTEFPGARGNGMLPGDVLAPGTSITSPNGVFRLSYTVQNGTGILQLENTATHTNVWKYGQNGVGSFIMQPDGNLVLYDVKVPIKHSNTYNSHGSRMYLLNDGTPAIFDMSQQRIGKFPYVERP